MLVGSLPRVAGLAACHSGYKLIAVYCTHSLHYITLVMAVVMILAKIL